MLSGTAKKAESPEHQQHPTTPTAPATGIVRSDAIPLALLAQHQRDVPAPTCSDPAEGRAAAVVTLNRAEGVDDVGQCSSAVAADAAAAGRGGLSTPMSASSTGAVPPRSPPVHNRATAQQPMGNAPVEAEETRRSPARQMGTGVLNNDVGAWTASGIPVSESRASKVDETVDIGAQANPSGVYPIVQPMAYLPRRQRPTSPPGTSPSRPKAARGAAGGTTKPMPVRAHPFGPAMQYLHHAQAFSRPFSAPASAFSSPGMRPAPRHAGGAVTHPPLPPGAGLRRAAARGKGGSGATGIGLSKAAIRTAARAAAAASVISAVADSKTVEARRAVAHAAAAAAFTAAAAPGTAELETGGGTVPTNRNRSKRDLDINPGREYGANIPSEVAPSRRPATAPAAFARASPGTASTAQHTSSKRTPDAPSRPVRRQHQNLQDPPLHIPSSVSSKRSSRPTHPTVAWSTGGATMPVPLPMSMAAARWHDPWELRTSFREAEGGSGALQPLRVQSTEGPQRASGFGPRPDSAAGERVAAGAVAAGARGVEKRTAQTEELAAMAVDAAANSSPDPEDIYADSWLTGLPWAASSPPNLDGLDVEGPLSPTPLDALRSDDRGTRGSDAADIVGEAQHGEETALFMGHHQPPPPTSVLQEALEAAGCGGATLGQHGTRTQLDRNAREGNELAGFPKHDGEETAHGTAAIRARGAAKQGASSWPQDSELKGGGRRGEGKISDDRPDAPSKRGRLTGLMDLSPSAQPATGAPDVGQGDALTTPFVFSLSRPSRSPSPLSPPLPPRRSPPAEASAQDVPRRTPARASVLPLEPPPQPQPRHRRQNTPYRSGIRSTPCTTPRSIEPQASFPADVPSPTAASATTPSLPDWALLPPPLPGLDPTSPAASPISSRYAESKQVPGASVPASDAVKGAVRGKVAHGVAASTDNTAAEVAASVRATRQASDSSNILAERARDRPAAAVSASLRRRPSGPSAVASMATMSRRGHSPAATEAETVEGAPAARASIAVTAAAAAAAAAAAVVAAAAEPAAAAAVVAAAAEPAAAAAPAPAGGAFQTAGRTRERAAGAAAALTPVTRRASKVSVSASLSPAARNRAAVSAVGSNIDTKASSSSPPQSLSDQSAAGQRDWRCSSPGCTNPAYFERRQQQPRPTAKRRRGNVDGAASTTTVEGCRPIRSSSRVTEEGAVERWCAAHQPEGSELSRSSICSFPGCRLMWAWGHEATTDPRGTVGDDKTPTRYCTQHKHDGMCQLREEGGVWDGKPGEEQACEGTGTVTATRRSKRRRSSGSVLE